MLQRAALLTSVQPLNKIRVSDAKRRSTEEADRWEDETGRKTKSSASREQPVGGRRCR